MTVNTKQKVAGWIALGISVFVLIVGLQESVKTVVLVGCLLWGDYSATSLDPIDALTFWTVQEYAAPHFGTTNKVWGTWIGAVSPY